MSGMVRYHCGCSCQHCYAQLNYTLGAFRVQPKLRANGNTSNLFCLYISLCIFCKLKRLSLYLYIYISCKCSRAVLCLFCPISYSNYCTIIGVAVRSLRGSYNSIYKLLEELYYGVYPTTKLGVEGMDRQ